MHGEINVMQNFRNIQFTQDILLPENFVELLINEALGGLRHDGVNVDPSQVVVRRRNIK